MNHVRKHMRETHKCNDSPGSHWCKTFKFCFQVANVLHPDDEVNTVIVLCFEGDDSDFNLDATICHSLLKQTVFRCPLCPFSIGRTFFLRKHLFEFHDPKETNKSKKGQRQPYRKVPDDARMAHGNPPPVRPACPESSATNRSRPINRDNTMFQIFYQHLTTDNVNQHFTTLYILKYLI